MLTIACEIDLCQRHMKTLLSLPHFLPATLRQWKALKRPTGPMSRHACKHGVAQFSAVTVYLTDKHENLRDPSRSIKVGATTEPFTDLQVLVLVLTH